MAINKRIFNLLDIQGKTASELAKFIGISSASVSAWKNEGSYPSSKYLKSISEFLNVTPDYLVLGVDNLPPTLRGDEKRLLRLYNELNDNGRRLSMLNMYKALRKNKEDREWWETHRDAVDRLMLEAFGEGRLAAPPTSSKPIDPDDDWYFEEDDFERDDSPFPVLKSVAVYYDQPASAGTGTFLDSNDYELIDFPIDKIPIQTTFGVRISGDSMTPDYQDEDIIFVKQQPTVEHGELAVFILNGGAYFKRLLKKGRATYLESLNKNYEPIQIMPSDELRVVGKVIGRYEGEPTESNMQKSRIVPLRIDRQMKIAETSQESNPALSVEKKKPKK